VTDIIAVMLQSCVMLCQAHTCLAQVWLAATEISPNLSSEHTPPWQCGNKHRVLRLRGSLVGYLALTYQLDSQFQTVTGELNPIPQDIAGEPVLAIRVSQNLDAMVRQD
jgi:hypothetical protein